MTGEFFSSTGGIVTIVMLLGIGAWMLYKGMSNRRKGQASTMWPTANGSIINAWVEANTETDDDGVSSTTYTPRWQYQFTASGQTYSSDRVSYGAVKNYSRRSKAVEMLARYQTNQPVQVYFDPEDPNESVLEPGTKGTLLGVIIGIVLILIGLVGVYLGGYLPF